MPKKRDYTARDLRYWSEKIEEILPKFGLDCYPQEFEIIDYETMITNQTYLGMPSFYPYWGFGKEYELTAIKYRHGLTYLAYELVINSNPAKAYLRQENDLALQILTMCHVYGHNNFFKNNNHFGRLTDADSIINFFKESAELIRNYSNNPAIGSEKVQKCLTAAHAVQHQCRDVSLPEKPDSGQNLLELLIDSSPRVIADWERKIVEIVIKTFDYFRPQTMTQIMNEGWASFWHYKLVEALKLPGNLRFRIGEHHSRVIRPPDDPTRINPYFIGFEMWHDIQHKHSEKMFDIMREEDDPSFIKKFMTLELMIKLGLFSYDGSLIVNGIPNQHDFSDIRNKLISNVGLRPIPVIQIESIDQGNPKILRLKHAFDGRHLDPSSTPKVLEHIHYFWPGEIILKTKTYKRHLPFLYRYTGTHHFKHRESKLI